MFSGAPTSFVIFFIFVAFLVACGFIFAIVGAIRSRAVLKKAGLSPLTAEAQIVGRLANSSMLAPAQGIEQHLAELEALHAKGTITDAELAAARAKALGG
jgi:hypothetical protein